MCVLLKRETEASLPVKVLQFGEGNFLRAFVDWMIDGMNRQGRFNGMVQIIQPLAKGLGEALNAQGGLYTLILRGQADGNPREEHRIIESVKGCVNPYEDWQGAVDAACAPELRFVFSNTTEAGIEHQPEEYTPGKCQRTFPAKVASLLYERWKAFGGDPAKAVVFLPCELIDKNGATLRRCVLQYAEEWGLPEAFRAWLGDACRYVNTLVDRIVAGYPREEAGEFQRRLGYKDNLLDCGELFHFLVLECAPETLEGLPLQECGFHVAVTSDQTPYRTRKVRFLNGAHTADVLAAAMAGVTFVDEMMKDPLFGKMARRAIYDEIFPTVPLPDQEKRFYADGVVERFLNPFAHHRLLSISLNSVSKWKVRVLPSLLDYLDQKGVLPPVLAFSLAALLRFYKLRKSGDGKATASLDGVSWPVSDSPEVLEFFAANAALPTEEYVRRALGNEAFWGQDLNRIPGLADAVSAHLDAMESKGVRGTVSSLLEGV